MAETSLRMTYTPMSLRIETERLVLTPEEPSDAPWFAELLNTRGVGTFTVDDATRRIAAMKATIEATGVGALVLRRRDVGAALGYVALVVGRSTLDEPEIAYELLPRFHGRGYATEAAGALLAAGFATGRQRIWATIGAWNAPSIRVAEKIGMRLRPPHDRGRSGRALDGGATAASRRAPRRRRDHSRTSPRKEHLVTGS